MKRILRSRGQIALVAIVTLVCAAFLSVQLIGPTDPGLSAEWQCSKRAGILLVCTKNHVAAPTASLPRQPSRMVSLVTPV
jgi:hypothetical protein